MNLLLNTNAIIWLAENSESLTIKARQCIESEDNIKFISIVSFWEMAIKISLDKLILNISIEQLATQFQSNGIAIIPISLENIAPITSLPFIHKDPFDRIIAGECLANYHTLVSSDDIFDSYGVNRFW